MKEERNYTVYKHTCPNGKVYIGITGRSPKIRWDYGRNYKNNKHFTNAIQKYGWDNIKHDVLFENLTKQQAEQKEIELISEYKATNSKYGYNIQNGGMLSGKMSDASKCKISISRKEYVRGKHPSAKRTICDGIIFECAKDCAEYYGLNYGTMKNWLNKRKRMPKEWINRGLRYENVDIEDYKIVKQNIKKHNINAKNVICEDKEFGSIRECAYYYNVSNTSMSDWLRGNQPIPKVFLDKGLRFADNSLNIQLKVQHGQNGDTCPHSKKIYCENKIFSSIRSFSLYYNLNYSTVKGWLSGRNRMQQKFVDLGLRYATEEEIIEYKNKKELGLVS